MFWCLRPRLSNCLFLNNVVVFLWFYLEKIEFSLLDVAQSICENYPLYLPLPSLSLFCGILEEKKEFIFEFCLNINQDASWERFSHDSFRIFLLRSWMRSFLEKSFFPRTALNAKETHLLL